MPPSGCSAGSGAGGSRWSSSSTTSAPSGSYAIAWWSSIPGERSRRGRPRRHSPRPRWSRSISGARDRAPLWADRETHVMIFAQNAVFGLLIGGLYGLAAVGLSLVFGVLKMLNVAHGELIMLGGFHLFLHRTLPGKALRATAEDVEAASLVGIPVPRIFLASFGLGSALAGVAGTLVGLTDAVSPAIGLSWTLKALIVVVLGGLGSIFGTFVAGLFLGVAESMSGFVLGNAYREVMGLVLFLLVLLLRPQGLFGSGPAA